MEAVVLEISLLRAYLEGALHLQVHTALTNLLLLLMLLLAVFLSLDYSLPIVWRDIEVTHDSD